MIKYLAFFILLSISNCYADDFFDRTSACRMEIKIIGPDVLEENDDCAWLVENVEQVVKKCSKCLPQLELIREASRGNFDY